MTSNHKKYNSKNPIQQFLISRFLQSISGLASEINAKTLLDIGSGEGFVLKAILRNNNFQAIALDPNENALIELKKRLPNVQVKSGYIQNLPYKDNSFDLVVCCEVLEHLKEPKLALKEIKRVGKNYIISVPNEPWFSHMNLMRGRHVSNFGCHPEHIQKWSTKKFVELVGNDLKIIKIKQSFPWTIVLAIK
ncbi:class I SAM-dependent methyltransferase [Patescibacteria group bacterium]